MAVFYMAETNHMWLTEHWKCGSPELGCPASIKYIPDFKDLIPKKVKCLICNFIMYEMITFLNIELSYINTHNVLL